MTIVDPTGAPLGAPNALVSPRGVRVLLLMPVPTGGGPTLKVFLAAWKLATLQAKARELGIGVRPHGLEGGDQANARAELLAHAFEVGSDIGAFLDADVEPSFDLLRAIVDVIVEDEKKGLPPSIVCVPYPSRHEGPKGWAWPMWHRPGPPEIRTAAGHRLLAIARIGCGFMGISRAAYEKIRAHLEVDEPDLSCVSPLSEKPIVAMFNPKPEPEGDTGIRRNKAEDFSFSRRAWAAGVPLEVLVDLHAPHRGLVAVQTLAADLGIPPSP